MNSIDAKQASDILYANWINGTRIDALPPHLRPTTRAEGYAVQQLIESHSSSVPFGWKLAATSEAGQGHISVDGPLAGRILKERVIADGASCPLGTNLMRVAELEFAFQFGRDIVPRRQAWTVHDALEQISTLHPAIELPDSRFSHFETAGAPQLIADNACAHFFLLGAPAPDSWRAIDLASHRVWGRVDNGEPISGVGRNVLGDPRTALVWFLNESARYGFTIRAGEIVTTGTCLTPIPVRPNNRIVGDFGPLGTVSIRLSE